MMFFVMFQLKMLNKLHTTILSQQMEWFGGKGLICNVGESKDQFPQMTWVMINARMLTKYPHLHSQIK
jgi:hypothetical protein